MEHSAQILWVGQEGATRSLPGLSPQHGWRLETAASAWEALEWARSGAGPDLLLLELAENDGEGLHPLRWLRRIRPELPVLVVADSEAGKVEALRLGARDYLVRPLHAQQLEMAIQ